MSLPSQPNSVTGAPIISQAIAWHKAGHGVALATVSQTWGSSPCPVGSHLAVRDDAAFEGSVSGGCIEGEVVTEALALIRAGAGCKSLDFGIAHEDAWHVGLACGGKVSVFVSALDDNTASVMKGLETAISKGKATALLADQNSGAHGLWADGALEAGDLDLNGAQVQELVARFASDRSGTIGGESEHPLFARVYNPRLRMFIVGAVHIAQNLAEMAARAGYDITVIDPRDTWGTDERFPGVKLDRRWPSIALEDLSPDTRTAVVTLSHDPKLDDPALLAAFDSPAFYIGCLGSKKTHAARLKRLRDAGVSDNHIARIHAPVGLDIGAQNPSEIAVATLAQITQALRRPV